MNPRTSGSGTPHVYTLTGASAALPVYSTVSVIRTGWQPAKSGLAQSYKDSSDWKRTGTTARRDAVNRVRRVSVYAPCVSRRISRFFFFSAARLFLSPSFRAFRPFPVLRLRPAARAPFVSLYTTLMHAHTRGVPELGRIRKIHAIANPEKAIRNDSY